MIGDKTKELIFENQDELFIPAEDVATVLYSHPLEHALLILSKVGYNEIPVLDSEDHLVGLISLANIFNRMIGLTGIDTSYLENLTVADVMSVNVHSVNSDDIEDALHMLVKYNFLPQVDKNGIFTGIITRQQVMKSMNHLVHQLEKKYILEDKIPLKK